MIGRTIGPYQLIERIERVGLHEAYRAIDPRRFGQPVVVTIADQPPGDEEFLTRYESAAERLTELRHPNFLPLLDFGAEGAQLYLVTPYLEGPTLADVIARPRRPAESLSLLATLGDALDYAHRLDLAHGELTPEAIQLANLPPGEDTLYAAWPLVLNFGFAGLIGPNALEGSIADAYLPPGEFGGPDKRADVYALAGLLHLMLTGAPPKVGGDPEALTGVGDGYAAVLRRALGANVADRYQSCPDLLVALRDAAAAERRSEDSAASALLEDARTAVAAGKFRAASEAYGAYLRLRPQDEMARREFATIESRRAEIARRRAAATAASAAKAAAAASATTEAGEGADASSEGASGGDGDVSGASRPPATMDAAPSPPGVKQRIKLASGPLVVPSKPASAPRSSSASGPPRAFDPIVAPARDRRQAILPAVLLALVLLIAIAVGGTLMSRRGNALVGGTPGPDGTRVVASPVVGAPAGSVRPVATNIPNSIPVAPTIAAFTPTPEPTLPPMEPVIIDPFDNHSSGFPPEPGGLEGAGYQNGEYALIVPDPDGFEIAELGGCPINGNCTFGDFQVEVDVWAVGPTAGGSYGLVFHRQFANSYTQYFVLIDPEAGTLRLVRWVDTERVDLIPATPYPAIAKGEGKNRLQITTKGQQITIRVNGTEVAKLNDNGPAVGVVALRADAGTGPIAVRFDNFLIRPVR